MTMYRTLEERIKFDAGLTIGVHPVTFQHGERYLRALVAIGARGKVSALIEPDESDMYSSWWQVKGDTTLPKGAVIVWGARDPELIKQFDSPVATISIVRGV